MSAGQPYWELVWYGMAWHLSSKKKTLESVRGMQITCTNTAAQLLSCPCMIRSQNFGKISQIWRNRTHDLRMLNCDGDEEVKDDLDSELCKVSAAGRRCWVQPKLFCRAQCSISLLPSYIFNAQLIFGLHVRVFTFIFIVWHSQHLRNPVIFCVEIIIANSVYRILALSSDSARACVCVSRSWHPIFSPLYDF